MWDKSSPKGFFVEFLCFGRVEPSVDSSGTLSPQHEAKGRSLVMTSKHFRDPFLFFVLKNGNGSITISGV